MELFVMAPVLQDHTLSRGWEHSTVHFEDDWHKHTELGISQIVLPPKSSFV